MSIYIPGRLPKHWPLNFYPGMFAFRGQKSQKIALILCLVLVASFVLSGCNNSDSIITLEDREVGKIEIRSGNTGETVEVTEEEVISQIADVLSLEFEKGEKSNDSTGWSYSVRWYDTEGKQIDTVVIMNDGTIEKDGYFWKTSKDNIELSVFDELVTKHSSELPLEWDKIPMVMVDGKLYYDTGKESTVSARCGVMDGEITSTVDGSEIPTKDNPFSMIFTVFFIFTSSFSFYYDYFSYSNLMISNMKIFSNMIYANTNLF